MDEQLAVDLAKTLGRDKVKFLIEWNGFKVFRIVLQARPGLHLGAPPLIVVANGKARFTDFDEELDIIDALPEV